MRGSRRAIRMIAASTDRFSEDQFHKSGITRDTLSRRAHMGTSPNPGTDQRHVAAVLETVERARSVGEFLSLTLEALDEHLGIRRSAFMLGLSEGESPGRAAYAGLQHGLKPYVMEEYFERWFHLDALTTDTASGPYPHYGRPATAAVSSHL